MNESCFREIMSAHRPFCSITRQTGYKMLRNTNAQRQNGNSDTVMTFLMYIFYCPCKQTHHDPLTEDAANNDPSAKGQILNAPLKML